jgi:NADH dehydrogenase
MIDMSNLHKIVIVGGGAGGLELATTLGNYFGRKGKAKITLVDKNRTHIWKPKLHELASGSMDFGDHEVDYMAQAHWHHFIFRIGELTDINRERKTIALSPYLDESGEEVTPPQIIPYDTLVLCIGSLSNDFGTPGVTDHAFRLETQEDAKRFHARMINACIRAHNQTQPLRDGQLHVAIIGAGATGIELAAELHHATREVISYGLDRLDPEKDLQVSIIEAAPKILPALPPRLSSATADLLKKLGVEIHTNSKVNEVVSNGIKLEDGRFIPSELVVWVAGIKASETLKNIGGLETNRINQLVVTETLQTTRDPNIFALGDCSACPWPRTNGDKNGLVPPRAQAAHQQANHMFKQIKLRFANKPLQKYRYRDFGSLVSLGKFSTVGNMMGGLVGKNLMVEGYFAKIMYQSLYKLHELKLHGWAKVTLDSLARIITRRTEPHIKLH